MKHCRHFNVFLNGLFQLFKDWQHRRLRHVQFQVQARGFRVLVCACSKGCLDEFGVVQNEFQWRAIVRARCGLNSFASHERGELDLGEINVDQLHVSAMKTLLPVRLNAREQNSAE